MLGSLTLLGIAYVLNQHGLIITNPSTWFLLGLVVLYGETIHRH